MRLTAHRTGERWVGDLEKEWEVRNFSKNTVNNRAKIGKTLAFLCGM